MIEKLRIKAVYDDFLNNVSLTKEQIEYLVKNGCLPDEDGEIDASDFKELSYDDLTVEELKVIAREKGIKGVSKLTKQELIDKINEKQGKLRINSIIFPLYFL